MLGLAAKNNRKKQEEEDLKMQWASQNNNELIIQSLDNDKNSFGEDLSVPFNTDSIDNTNEIMPHSNSIASKVFNSAKRLGTEQQHMSINEES